MRTLYAAQLRTVDFEINAPQRVTVFGSSRAMDVILRNLLRNAFTHTVRGKILVEIRADSLRLKDTGMGIPDEIREHVFKRFYSTGAKPGNRGGSGIGLALVKRLCELGAWQIDLTSDVASGTEVILYWNRPDLST